jgi:hypothetical protein
MKLQTKFDRGIIFVFLSQVVTIGTWTVRNVSINSIREAKNHVRIHTRAAREMQGGQLACIQAALQVSARSQPVEDLLQLQVLM